jgi:hypothetical protein
MMPSGYELLWLAPGGTAAGIMLVMTGLNLLAGMERGLNERSPAPTLITITGAAPAEPTPAPQPEQPQHVAAEPAQPQNVAAQPGELRIIDLVAAEMSAPITAPALGPSPSVPGTQRHRHERARRPIATHFLCQPPAAPAGPIEAESGP